MADREELPVSQARAGEETAWRILFQRYQLPLYAYVAQLVRHEQTSLDIVQETFIQASRKLDSLREDAKFGSWLFSIAHQKCIQHWRKENRSIFLEETNLPDLQDDAGNARDWLIRKERQEQFLHRLEQLPPPHRSVLLLHFLEGFSLEDISMIVGTPLGTVKSRIYHAKKQLRDGMKGEA